MWLLDRSSVQLCWFFNVPMPAIAVVSTAPKRTMFDPGPAFYMDNPVDHSETRGKLDINASVADNMTNTAEALGKEIESLLILY